MKDFSGEKKTIRQVSVEEAKEATAKEGIQFVDVRRVQEYANGHATNTINLPLDILSRELDNIHPDKPTYVICQGGYRASLGTSILENAGFKEIYNVTGGTKAWMDAGLETEVSATACANS
jgi:rhodanese-related sulfurtransferase